MDETDMWLSVALMVVVVLLYVACTGRSRHDPAEIPVEDDEPWDDGRDGR